MSHVDIRASSDGLGWRGLELEVGSNHGWDVDDLMVDGHQVCINLADTSLLLRIRNESKWTTTRMPPLTFWINPEGRPFSLRHSQDALWANCVIEGRFLDEIVGSHHELHAGYGIADEVLAHLLRALIALLQERKPVSPALSSDLIRSFVHALATRHGEPAEELAAKGGIAAAQLKSLLAWVADNLGSSLTVDAMAAKVGLSAAHFSREFKRSTGLTPWGYVVQLRLEAARKHLAAGESVCTAAHRTGFSDQPHLSRLFKQRFGVSPSSFGKSARRDGRSLSIQL